MEKPNLIKTVMQIVNGNSPPDGVIIRPDDITEIVNLCEEYKFQSGSEKFTREFEAILDKILGRRER